MADLVRSAARAQGPQPHVCVVVSTYRRARFVAGLVAALEAQQDAPPFEVVLVDNGSDDATWPAVCAAAERTPLALTGLRLPRNLGPGPARNRGAAQARAQYLAFTDDDCLPSPGWVRGLAAAVADDVDVVQGPTAPVDEPAPGAWARSVWVSGPTPWFETCNVAYRRSAFEAVGGFDEVDPLTGRGDGGRPFGEDAVLGARVLARGGRSVFAPGALVHHRWMPGGFRAHLGERRHLRGFPGLARQVPAVADALWLGVFLSRRTAAVDAAAAAVLAAAATRRPAVLAAALPWLATAWGPARARRGSTALRLAQGAVADAAGLAALLEGSVRHRRLVL